MLIEPLETAVQQPSAVRVSDVFAQWYPPRWYIGDEGGQPARFGPAGFVLTVGRKYQLLVAQPVDAVTLVGYPSDFIRPAAERQTIVVKGVDYMALPFRVRLDVARLLRPFLRPGIHPRCLAVDCIGPEGQRRHLEIPVLLRRGWTCMYVVVLLLLALGSIAFNIITQASKAPDRLSALEESLRSTFSFPNLWWIIAIPVALAALKIIALDYAAGFVAARGQREAFSGG